MPGGRPQKYNRKQCLQIIHRELAKGDRGLIDLCKDKALGLPTHEQIYLWVSEGTPESKELYHIFMEAQKLWTLAQRDLIITIADNESRDYIENTIKVTTADGETKEEVVRRSDNTPVNRDKLRITTRQWAMAKLYPKLFGDVQQIEHSGKIEYENTVDRPAKEGFEEWEKRVKAQLEEMKNQVH